MRKKIVAGNWKMNKTLDESIEFIESLKMKLNTINPDFPVLIFPPFISLNASAKLSKDHSQLFIGAQNCHSEDSGAYTGEVSAQMIASTGCSHVLVGHSERREYQQEDSSELLKKCHQAIENNLDVVFCVGETLEERKSQKHEQVVEKQIQEVLASMDERLITKVAVAYEPVWAIGTGETASPEQAEQMHAHIRKVLSKIFGQGKADSTSILYGGSVKPANAEQLFSQANIDGALIGGASLKVDDFSSIIKTMNKL